jgi:predicted XRE-type DNA-binding protein
MSIRHTDNIFEQLGFEQPEAANMKIRAELLLEIREQLRKKGLKQKEAAALLEINQPEVSALMNGMIYKFSIDALVNMLARLGQEVKITRRRKAA